MEKFDGMKKRRHTGSCSGGPQQKLICFLPPSLPAAPSERRLGPPASPTPWSWSRWHPFDSPHHPAGVIRTSSWHQVDQVSCLGLSSSLLPSSKTSSSSLCYSYVYMILFVNERNKILCFIFDAVYFIPWIDFMRVWDNEVLEFINWSC